MSINEINQLVKCIHDTWPRRNEEENVKQLMKQLFIQQMLNREISADLDDAIEALGADCFDENEKPLDTPIVCQGICWLRSKACPDLTTFEKLMWSTKLVENHGNQYDLERLKPMVMTYLIDVMLGFRTKPRKEYDQLEEDMMEAAVRLIERDT